MSTRLIGIELFVNITVGDPGRYNSVRQKGKWKTDIPDQFWTSRFI
jgi:hypothetical protein